MTKVKCSHTNFCGASSSLCQHGRVHEGSKWCNIVCASCECPTARCEPVKATGMTSPLNPHDTDKDREQGKHWGRARDWQDGFDAAMEWLASKCGPEPCLTCRTVNGNPVSVDMKRQCLESGGCDKLHIYEGQQAGLAKGLQEVKRAEKYWESRLHDEIHKERLPEGPLKDINVL